MLKRVFAVSLTVGLATVMLTRCSSNSTSSVVGKGTVYSFVGDAPLCDVLAFHSTITSLTVAPSNGANAVELVNPNSALIKVDFLALKDFSTILALTSVPAGTYSQMTIGIESATMVVYDPAQSPPTHSVGVTFSNTKPTIAISPPLTVMPNQPIAMKIDFNLRQSVQLDSSGQVTGHAAAVFTATPLTASGTQGFGEMDDVLGFVQRVDTFSSNTAFIGDFALQLLQGSGPSVVTNLTSTTQVCGPAPATDTPCIPLALNQLLTGSFVEVDGFVDSSGNFEANYVEVEDQEVTENNMIAFLGDVVSVTRDPSGSLTQFELYVREEEPDDEVGGIGVDSTVAVNVNSSTIYQFSSRPTNFANISFNSASINVGQQLVVHGVFTVPKASTGSSVNQLATVASDRIYLKVQTDEGNLTSLIQAGADDKTGAFNFRPCGGIFQSAPVMVFTSNQTAFVGVVGLNELTPQSSLLIKGLLFFEPQVTTVNGFAVPAGTWVLLAKQVHREI